MNLERRVRSVLMSASSGIQAPPPPPAEEVMRRGRQRRIARISFTSVISILVLVAVTMFATALDLKTSISGVADDGSCPVTIPVSGFVPGSPHPPSPNAPGHVWYGTVDLWTSLRADGSSDLRKSVWWSANFPGGFEEEKPAISVSYVRLDGDGEVRSEGAGTNAYTPEEGWFMFADIPALTAPGCWEITANYKGATLSYIWELPFPE